MTTTTQPVPPAAILLTAGSYRAMVLDGRGKTGPSAVFSTKGASAVFSTKALPAVLPRLPPRPENPLSWLARQMGMPGS